MSKEIEIEIPSSWSEVTVGQFQELQKYQINDYESKILYMVDLVSSLTGVDKEFIMGVNIENLNLIVENMSWIKEELPNELIKEIEYEGVKYKWKDGFNSLTVGEMISIEQVVDMEDLTYNLAFDVILAILLRETKEDGTLEEFDSDKFIERRELFSNLPITDIYGMIVFFSNGVNNSTPNTQVSLKVVKKKKNSQKRKWSWIKKSVSQIIL